MLDQHLPFSGHLVLSTKYATLAKSPLSYQYRRREGRGGEGRGGEGEERRGEGRGEGEHMSGIFATVGLLGAKMSSFI